MDAEVFWIMQVETHAILFFSYNIHKTPPVLSAGTKSELPFQAHTRHSMLQNHFEALLILAFSYPHFFLNSMIFFSQTS